MVLQSLIPTKLGAFLYKEPIRALLAVVSTAGAAKWSVLEVATVQVSTFNSGRFIPSCKHLYSICKKKSQVTITRNMVIASLLSLYDLDVIAPLL
jgi:hypothetical protein